MRSDFWALGLLAAGGLHADLARAEAPPFFQNKTITITVGFSPGGLYDQTARAIARQLGRHIEGNPTVIVQNKPGAGGMLGVETVLRVQRMATRFLQQPMWYRVHHTL